MSISPRGIRDHDKTPLFRSAAGRTGILTDRPMHRVDAYETMRRRTAEAGFKGKTRLPRVPGDRITAYLEAGETLENAQAMARTKARARPSFMTAPGEITPMKSSGSIFSSQSPLAHRRRDARLCTFVTAICMRCGA